MSKMSGIDTDRQQIERLTDVARPPKFSDSARAGLRIVPPPPEPEPIWLHGKPSVTHATVLIVCFATYLAGIISFMVWQYIKTGAP